ncbi:hypothetical protein SNE40_012265 [Patella caerulea]|uniref:Uncharacterized protein n=1 Tax=Patella caerulea TaxID=87958 RepID=A0AAN8JLH6_PATCE
MASHDEKKRHKYCANPFNTHVVHQKKDLRPVSESFLIKFPSVLKAGQKLCTGCRKTLSTKQPEGMEMHISSPSSSEDAHFAQPFPKERHGTSLSSNEEVFDKTVEVEVLNRSLSIIGESPFDKRKAERSQEYLSSKRAKVADSVKKKLSLVAGPSREGESDAPPKCQDNCMPDVIKGIKEKYRVSSRTEQLQILTLFCGHMTIRSMMQEFECSQRMAVQARKLLEEKGMLATPNPKLGRTLPAEVEALVEKFYYSDQISRVMPGQKDFVSVKTTTGKERKQKRLVLSNLREAYQKFREDHPTTKVGFSKFATMRPQECVLAGSSGTHSVCVCTFHQNVKLMIIGSKMKEVTGIETYHDVIAMIVCNPAQPSCYFRTCSSCPSVDAFENELGELYELEGMDEVQFQQWTSTDRSELSTMVLSTEEFLGKFVQKATVLTRHDFVAKAQSEFLKDVKDKLVEGEFAVIGDFSENYSFVIQDAAQGFHWNNSQCTIHPWVFYWRSNGELKHGSFTVISECNTHDFVAVHLFQKMVIEHLKSEFPLIHKIFYFSDGCAGQYKNCKSFLNLCLHEEDYGIKAEWHFFATSHGKGPSDGVGGTLKREATRESLRRPYSDQIISPMKLFEYANRDLGNMKFGYATQKDHVLEAQLLRDRSIVAKTIPGTQKLHSLKPLSKTTLEVREFSSSNSSRLESVTAEHSSPLQMNLAGYVTVQYDSKWWLASILESLPSEREVKVNFLHPNGPSNNFFFPDIEDQYIIDSRDILVPVNPKTATGRTYTLSKKEINATNKAMGNKK